MPQREGPTEVKQIALIEVLSEVIIMCIVHALLDQRVSVVHIVEVANQLVALRPLLELQSPQHREYVIHEQRVTPLHCE